MIYARHFKYPRNQRLPSLLIISASFSLESFIHEMEHSPTCLSAVILEPSFAVVACRLDVFGAR